MSNYIIKINRGDSFEFDLIIPKKDDLKQSHILDENSAIYFAIMYPYQRFEDALFLKGFNHKDQDKETGIIKVKLLPNDTRKIEPGIYYYTVKLQKGGTLDIINDLDEPDEVRTIIERTKFIINE